MSDQLRWTNDRLDALDRKERAATEEGPDGEQDDDSNGGGTVIDTQEEPADDNGEAEVSDDDFTMEPPAVKIKLEEGGAMRDSVGPSTAPTEGARGWTNHRHRRITRG